MLTESRIPLGYIVKKVWRDAITAVVIAVVVEVLIHLNRKYVPVVPAALPAFLGTAISLLLSFKLNQSYDRWWEARKIWGAIVNDSRSLVRQALTFVEPVAPDRVERLARRQIAWCYSLGQSLRRLDWKKGTEGHLREEDLAAVAPIGNKPLALLQLHAEDVAGLARDGHLTDFQRIQLDDTLRRLTDWMGMCERIRSTVFPRTYRAFLKVFIYMFITVLAIALADVQGGWQIAMTTALAIPFFLLERTASHMQDPFENRPTDTAMTAIARTIEINILQLIGESDVPEPVPPEDFYLM